MMTQDRWLVRVYVGLVLFAIVGSATAQLAHIDPGPIGPVTGMLVTVVGGLMVAREIGNWRHVAAIMIFTTLFELLGVLTGWPFGAYSYTTNWWPTVPLIPRSEFPLLVPIAWVVIAGGSSVITMARFGPRFGLWLGALLAMLIDVPMEFVMTQQVGYWRWERPDLIFSAPLTNSVGWFIGSLVVGLIIRRSGPPRSIVLSATSITFFLLFMLVHIIVSPPRDLVAMLMIAALILTTGVLGWAPRKNRDTSPPNP